MKTEHVLSDEVTDLIQSALNRNENWMAYNNSLYFIDTNDVRFFKDKHAAMNFAADNISDYDHYTVIHFLSIADVFRQIPYGEKFNKPINNPDANGLHNPDGNAFTDALIDYIEQQQILKPKHLSIMNEKNFDYLKDNLKYLGFGEKQHEALEQQLKEGKESFQLTYSAEVNKKPFEAVLQFRRSDTTDMYFLNNYTASLERSNGEKVEQTFYLNNGKGVTAKEAFNLLEGRAVHKELTNKEGETYTAWIQLDADKFKGTNHEIKQFHQNYGYDLKEALSYYPVKEMMKEEDSKVLLRSLEKGNVQQVTLLAPAGEVKVFLEANPQYKSIHVYDAQMKRMSNEQRQEVMISPEMKEGKGQGKEQVNGKEKSREPDHEDQAEKKQGKGRKISSGAGSEDNGLVKKKRTNTSKGLSL